ncbi:carcinoembryonic antigen-related cell adhesion molecule 18-like [Antechinus flavipes]|uniref:carcinoembryonic antigen-related cell adhesion molecule 18-like n=1 Tax=Antechinus flavipes TaxID=38775 RepID=UPI0022359068|nr:carcinoembryonic antigen-related cell adhesion molecule 18-like [Antechinus flavipes]
MELPSGALLGTGIHCQRLLLTAILLASTATAQLTLSPKNPEWIEGYPFIWKINGAPTGDVNYTWYRGDGTNELNMVASYVSPPPRWIIGLANTGRENVTAQGFLNITKVEMRDAGNYTIVVTTPEGSQEATGQMRVWEDVLQPDITVNTTSAAELMDIVNFTCHPRNSGNMQIKWYLNYGPVSQGDQWTLSPDNRTLTGWVTRFQKGPFYCQVSNPIFSERSIFKYLDIYYGPDSISRKSSPPTYGGRIESRLGYGVEMECSTTSNPASRYRWLRNGIALQSTTSTYNISSMSLADVGTYRCIAENPKTQVVLYSTVVLRVYEDLSFSNGIPYVLPQGAVIFFSIGVSLGLLSLIGALIFYLVSRR